MSVPSSTVPLLTMMTFLLWLTVQLTSQPSLAYNLYPMPDNWEPVAVLNYTDNHNIASLLTGDSLVPNATKCVSNLNTHLNTSQVCKRQLYDWIKIGMDYGKIDYVKRRMLIRKFVQFTLTCYFRLACVHCPADQLIEYRKAVKDWFPNFQCHGGICPHEEWHPPRLTECFNPPVNELAQCDAALEQAAATDKCTAQVQLKLSQSKEDNNKHFDVKCEAEYEDRMCMVAQVCAHCQPEHVPKYFEYWNKVWDPVYEKCWRHKVYFDYPKRVCTVAWYRTPVNIIGAVVAVVGFIISLICCRKCLAKRTRKYGSLGTGRGCSKSRSTSRSSSSSIKAK